jgi:segregation and condensation protein B
VTEHETSPSQPTPADPSAHGELPPLPAALEALLLVTDEPVPAVTLAQVVERPTTEVERVLSELADDYTQAGRGFELRQIAGGWRLYTRADCAPYVERFVLDGQQARLTQAALETLAVIAYRQPITRQRVSAVRGVNVDGVVRTLVARGLITEAGPDEDTGAIRYRTTSYLLERLGLESLDELPSLAPLLPELDDMLADSSSS